MKALYNLKEMLCAELADYGKKPDLNASSLDMIDKIAHAAKNVCKVIEFCEEDEHSERSYRSYRSYDDGRSYDGMAYESRRRDPMGRYAVERGRAWADGSNDTMQRLEELKGSADENTRRVIDKALRELRN